MNSPRIPTTRTTFSRTIALGAAALALAAGLPTSFGQVVGSVYMDDSPGAQDGMARAVELAGIGNLDEASRVLQRLLEENAEQLVQESPADVDLYVTVRSRVHAVLLANPALLERYRALEQPTARALLTTDQVERCERTRLLTTSGLDAALRLAQGHLDRARFFAAVRLLKSIDAHPDLTGDRLKGAADLLASTAAYLSADKRTPTEALEDATRYATSWRERAGMPAGELPPAEIPRSETGINVLDPQPAATLGDVLPRPLASEFLGSSLDGVEFLSSRIVQNQRGVSDRAAVLHAVPTIAGDSLYVNDSETITAWDRYTLSRRWRVRIEPPTTVAMVNASGGLGIEDCNWTAVEGRRLATVSGLTMLQRTQSERAISVLDTRDGRVLWTTTLSQLGPAILAECFPRGPVVIDQGVVVVSAARNSVEKRLQGALMIGLDAETGRLLWWRNLGSLGVVPWGMGTFPADVTRAAAGIAYRADRTGVIAALDTVTGRTIWARRLSPDPVAGSGLNRGGRIVPWEGNTPVIDAGRLIVLSPDKRMIVVMEAATGRVLERIPAQALNNPDYLLHAPSLKAGEASRLICVAPSQIGMVDLASNVAGAPYHLLATVLAPGIRGRVMIAGDEIIIPTIEGAVVAPIRQGPAPDQPPESRTIKLNRPGQVIASGGQLIAVDDQQAHSYLLWETAEKLLDGRMKADPSNPQPAVTYAELAYQAGKHEKLVPAVDRAVAAMERDPLSNASNAARRRLFVSLMDMIEPPPDASAPARLSDTTRAEILGRVEQLAAAPAEQVRATMAAALLAEGGGRIPEAVERYQSVLLTPALAKETYAKGGTTLPADAEATRRLRRLVREHGRTVYAAYDDEASTKLAAARTAGTDTDLESIARSYPVSAAAPRAWLDLAERHRRAGREALALAALDEALGAATASLTPVDPMLAEVCAEVAARIGQSERPRTALRMLDAVERAMGDRPLIAAGGATPVDLSQVRRELASRLAASERRAAIGAPSGSASVMNGWGVLTPICGETPGAPTDRVVLGASTGEIAVWKPARSPDGQPALEKVWGDTKAEAFLRMDSRSVLLAKASPTAPPNTRGDLAFVRRDLATGNAMWEVQSFRALFTERSRRPFPSTDERIDTPLRAQIPASELVVLADERTLVLMDRVGRAAAFDHDTGRLLWASELAVDRVYDAALNDGVLAVGGTPARSGPHAPVIPAAKQAAERKAQAEQEGIDAVDAAAEEDEDGSPAVTVVQVLGARTGISQSIRPERTEVRWVRITPEGWVVYAGATSVTCLDAYRLEARWRTEGSLVQDTVTAWAAPGRIVTRDSDGKFRLIRSETGEVLPPTLDTLGKADQPFIEAHAAPVNGRTAILSSRGIVVHDDAGKLVAADALGSETVVRPPLLARETALIVEQSPMESAGSDTGPFTFGVHVVSTVTGKMLGTAKVELPRSPTDAAALDGMIIVSCGSSCILLNAPGVMPPAGGDVPKP